MKQIGLRFTILGFGIASSACAELHYEKMGLLMFWIMLGFAWRLLCVKPKDGEEKP
jgi:hypothetical protein